MVRVKINHGLTRIFTDFFVFVKFYLTQHRDVESSHNGADNRIWVDPTSPCGLRRAGRKEVSYYGIKGKGVGKIFAIWVFF